MKPIAKRILSMVIFNIILFLVYYLLNVLKDVIVYFFKISDPGSIPDMIITFIVWIGFFTLYAFMISDRKAFGISYLSESELTRPTPREAFNPLLELKRGKIDTIIYAVMSLIPALWYLFDGIKIGINDVPAELFLPQTFFIKITMNAPVGFILGVTIFWFFSCFVTYKSRKKWIVTPLTIEETNSIYSSDAPNEDTDQTDLNTNK